MKALFVSNDPTLFAEGSAARERMKAYAEAIGELHIVSAAPRGACAATDGPLHLHPVRAWKPLRMRVLAREAHALILAHGIEVVSAQDPFELGAAAFEAMKGTSAKLHIQVHTDFLSPWFVRSGGWRSLRVRMPLLNRLRRRFADDVLPKADGIRVVSERVKQSLVAHYAGRIVEPAVIPIAVSSNAPEPVSLPAHPFTFALIAVGRLEPEKRLEDILAALALIAPKYPMAGLFVAGEGRERRRLERMARRLGLSDRVIFLGARPDAWGLMRSAQAFIQASAYEGYGRTLVEAALAEVPIITTDVGIVGEVFTGYEDVLAVPVADPTALSLAIVGLIEDVGFRLELPHHAAEKARAHLATVGDLPARIRDDLARMLAVQGETLGKKSRMR